MAQVVRIGKKKYAVGLSWGPLSPDRPLRPQAIEKTRNSKNDLFVTAGDVEPMVGHCDQGNGVKAGLPVLAPLVADVWPANTLIALVPDGQSAIGFQILNGIVFDDVCGPSDEIRTWFDGIVGDHKWDHVSSPWGGGSAGTSSFEDSIRTSGVKPPRLHSVSEGRSSAIKVAALVLLVLAGFLVVSKIARDRRELADRLAMLSRHVVIRVTPPVRIVPVWSFVAGCVRAMGRIPSEAAGWTVKSLSCRPDRILILWKRSSGSGTVRDLERSLRTRVRLVGKNGAKSKVPLAVPEFETPVEKLPRLSEEKKDLASVLEYYNLDYQADNESFLPGFGSPGGDGFSVSLPDIPEGGLLSALSNVFGLSARSLEWAENSQWILKGEMKHAPIVLVRGRSDGRSGGMGSRSDASGPGGKPESDLSPPGKSGGAPVRERRLAPDPGKSTAGAQNALSGRGAGGPGTSLTPLRIPSTPGSRLPGNP